VDLVRTPLQIDLFRAPRRGHYLEFLFRTSLFGEFKNLPAVHFAPLVMGIALLLVPWGLRGMLLVKGERARNFPFLIVSLCVLSVGLAYTLGFPFAPGQSFRYVPFLGLAAAYFLALGIAQSKPLLRTAGITLLTAFCFLSTWLLVAPL